MILNQKKVKKGNNLFVINLLNYLLKNNILILVNNYFYYKLYKIFN